MQKVLRVTLRVVGSTVSATLLVSAGYGWSLARGLDDVHHLSIAAINSPATPSSTPTPGVVPKVEGSTENILVVGDDSRDDLTPAEEKLLGTGSDVSNSTDTMLLIHVPAGGARATMVSLPRDAYVSIPGYGMNKLNAAYALGVANAKGTADQQRAAGASLLIHTVENLTGETVNHYVQIGLIGFYRIASAIGGVPVTLCHAVNDSAAANRAAGLQGGSGFVMSAGTHVLTPVQALEFVRQRHFLPNGDIDRTARQRYFITAAFAKIETAGVLLNPVKLNSLVSALTESVYVDSGFSILSLAEQVSTLSPSDISGKVIPFENYATVQIDGESSSVEIVDPATVQAFLAAAFAPPTPSQPTTPTSRPVSTATPKPAPTPAASTASKPAAASCVN